MKETILIAGGTGLIGSRLVELIDSSQYDIKILSRSRKNDEGHISYYQWDLDQMTIDSEALEADYIINFTGAGIADSRWSEERKKVLIDSRVKSAELIKKGLEENNKKVKAYISASAIGFYGDRGEEVLTEDSDNGDMESFMVKCCVLWEDAAKMLSNYCDRLIINRIGLVLSPDGGALPKILMTKALGVYAYFGNGKQYYPWIHIDDVCEIFLQPLKDQSYQGIYNTVSPEPLPNKKFTEIIKNTLNGWVTVPAPTLALRLAMGEIADVVLNSNRVVPKNLERHNFKFKFTSLSDAIKDLV